MHQEVAIEGSNGNSPGTHSQRSLARTALCPEPNDRPRTQRAKRVSLNERQHAILRSSIQTMRPHKPTIGRAMLCKQELLPAPLTVQNHTITIRELRSPRLPESNDGRAPVDSPNKHGRDSSDTSRCTPPPQISRRAIHQAEFSRVRCDACPNDEAKVTPKQARLHSGDRHRHTARTTRKSPRSKRRHPWTGRGHCQRLHPRKAAANHKTMAACAPLRDGMI